VVSHAPKNIPAIKKNVDISEVQIHVKKLAATSGDCAIFKFAAFQLLRVTKIVKLAGKENIFL
jgi:hypothetical protein